MPRRKKHLKRLYLEKKVSMILNGLGLVSSPLYLFSKFFEGKAIEHLIGGGRKPNILRMIDGEEY